MAIALSALALAAPFAIADAPVLRAGVALYLLWSCFKVIDLVRDPVRRSARFRLLQALVIYDLRRDSAANSAANSAASSLARPELHLRWLVTAIAAGLAAVASLELALFVAPELGSPLVARLLRHIAGMAFAYFGIEAMLRLFRFVYCGVGLRPPVLHDHPILSRSLAEFWGRRWNRVVGGWLHATFYRPLALRAHRVLGVFAAFAGSAGLHFYFTWAAVGSFWALCMAAFFLLQAPLVLLERRWGQRSWREPWRRLWTVAVLVLTSPLFIEPLLEIMRGGFSPPGQLSFSPAATAGR